jgi:thiol-disulfide isomerase/thioredoxin
MMPKMRRGVLILLMVLGGAVIAAAAGGWHLFQQRSPQPASGGGLAPDFLLTDLDGKAFRLSDFRGKVVVIDFMSTWCRPCRQQMPHLKAVWEKEDYRGRVILISIDVDVAEPEEALRSYRQGYPYATWICAKDTAEQRVAQSYRVVAIPTIVIIDQEGYARFRHVGLTDASTLIQEIDQLLGRAR